MRLVRRKFVRYLGVEGNDAVVELEGARDFTFLDIPDGAWGVEEFEVFALRPGNSTGEFNKQRFIFGTGHASVDQAKEEIDARVVVLYYRLGASFVNTIDGIKILEKGDIFVRTEILMGEGESEGEVRGADVFEQLRGGGGMQP